MSSNEPNLSPQALLDFFQALASDEVDPQPCQLHYGCSCMVQRGTIAAEKLITIQNLLGVESAASRAAGAGETGEQGEGSAADLEQRISDADKAQRDLASRLDRAVKQNLKLADENIRLEQRARKLQDQINRLMDMREMSSILGRLEKRAPVETSVSEPEPQPESAQPESPAAAADPEDLFEFESAVPFRESPGAS